MLCAVLTEVQVWRWSSYVANLRVQRAQLVGRTGGSRHCAHSSACTSSRGVSVAGQCEKRTWGLSCHLGGTTACTPRRPLSSAGVQRCTRTVHAHAARWNPAVLSDVSAVARHSEELFRAVQSFSELFSAFRKRQTRSHSGERTSEMGLFGVCQRLSRHNPVFSEWVAFQSFSKLLPALGGFQG